MTVQLAVPGDPVFEPLRTKDITGSEIDAALSYLSYAGSTWKVATTSGQSWFGPTNVHVGTRVLVVAHNGLLPGLVSFPAIGTINFVPGGPGCPDCHPR
ncbi:MAG: hypothetical protein ACE5ED_03160 [Rhodothalassiaceae bacterium]